jgi:CheY-like chemotaxis protein
MQTPGHLWSRPSPSQKSVLMIDDDADVHRIVKGTLEPLGYRFTSALDATVGLQIARTAKPDVVILDILMPTGDGYSVHEWLRNDPLTAQIPILVYSALKKEDIARRLGGLAGVAILEKPSRGLDLVDAVRDLLKE